MKDESKEGKKIVTVVWRENYGGVHTIDESLYLNHFVNAHGIIHLRCKNKDVHFFYLIPMKNLEYFCITTYESNDSR